jgi:hypothetical protein
MWYMWYATVLWSPGENDCGLYLPISSHGYSFTPDLKRKSCNQ